MNEIEKLESIIIRLTDPDLPQGVKDAVLEHNGQKLLEATTDHLHYKREIEPFVLNLLSKICDIDIDKSAQSDRDIIYSMQTIAANIATKMKERTE